MSIDPHTARARPIRVLIVEDDADSRDMYAMALGLAGIEVHLASEAAAAFTLAVTARPDVVVTDFVLRGEGNGATLCHEIHRDPRTAGIKVLVVTGSTRKADVEALLGAGCSDIRTKPYLPQALIDDIEEMMSEQPPAHAF